MHVALIPALLPTGEWDDTPLQYYSLENPMDRGAWWATVHVAAELDSTEWLTHTHCYLLGV